MSIRERNGKLEWRFKANGHEFSHITDLADTARNRTRAAQMEAEARRLVMSGRESELRIAAEPFSSAAEAFIVWARGEYREHPNSAKRLSVSMSTTKAFFGKRPLSSLTRGDLEDYKSYRRTVHKVREVTLRHDLHALSLLFQYGEKHGWCRGNPVRHVEIPSDADAVRINVLSPADEMRLFAAIEDLSVEAAAKKRTKRLRALADIKDLAVLMLNQGCRPTELRALQQTDIDLEHGTMTIRQGKSKAACRVLPMTAASRGVLTRRLQRPGVWAFPSQLRAGSKHIGQYQRRWDAVMEKAGLTCVLYDLRHTFATRAVERGVELPKLMAILGHSNLRSIMRYVHMSQTHIVEGMQTFEAGEQFLPTACPLPGAKTGEQEGKREITTKDASERRIN